jgi:hypothetical protein
MRLSSPEVHVQREAVTKEEKPKAKVAEETAALLL